MLDFDAATLLAQARTTTGLHRIGAKLGVRPGKT